MASPTFTPGASMTETPPIIADFSTLAQATSKLGHHVETLVWNEVFKYVYLHLSLSRNSTTYCWAASNPERVKTVAQPGGPLRLVSAWEGYLKRCIDVGDASVQIARRSVTLFSALMDTGLVDDTSILYEIQHTFVAIELARTAWSNFRLAEDEVSDFPKFTGESDHR